VSTESITVKKLYNPLSKYFSINSTQKTESSIQIKPVPLDMAYFYSKVQAIKGRPQAIELIDILGANGLERLVELADTTFNAAIETEAYD
jgi:hypothetical protein